MQTPTETIRSDFAAFEDRLDVFELFSGTGTPGENGAPDMPSPGEDDPGLTVSDSLAIGSFASFGLSGVSYALMRYSKTNPVATVIEPMKLLYEKIQIGKALEAAQQGKDMTKLMELLPYVGTPVKRMNIDAIWEEVGDILKIMQLNVDRARLAIEPVDHSMDTLHSVSKAAYPAFFSIGVMGAAATALTARFHDRAFPLLDDLEDESAALGGAAARMARKAVDEFEHRSFDALEGLDAKLLEVETLAGKLPDFSGLLDLVAEAETLFEPITQLSADITGLVEPYEDFLDVAKVIGAPIEGVLNLFENPPKVLPTIIGYETITPGFWITVPDPTWSDPFRTKKVWVPPVRVPIPGFKELFDPIPREEVQKIIDLILDIAGLPMELLEKALAPILTPIQNTIDKIMKPIIEQLNPFDDYLDDFKLAEETFAALREKVETVVENIEEAVDKVSAIRPDLDPVEEIGEIDPAGMATFFGAKAGEKIVGRLPEKDGGFMNGALLQGNGGKDLVIGTKADDLLGGGAGNDRVLARNGADFVLGGDGADSLYGGAGGDVIIGGGGADFIKGGAGADHMFGGAGPDRMDGGRGRDVYDGGGEADLFVFGAKSGRDTVVNWEDGLDQFVIRAGARKFQDLSFRDAGDDVRIVYNGAKILVKDAEVSDLDRSDFVFA